MQGNHRVGLTQLIRFLVVKLTHPSSNLRFDMSITFTTNILSMVVNVSIDNETLFVTDFINLKIKLAQSFGDAHKSRCACVFIGVSSQTCMSICVYTVFKKTYGKLSVVKIPFIFILAVRLMRMSNGRVGLARLVRFLVVELTHPGSNPRFDMGVACTANYSFSEMRRPRQQRCALDDRLCES
jgi:hypothetical protein